jgi:hypothetical protein
VQVPVSLDIVVVVIVVVHLPGGFVQTQPSTRTPTGGEGEFSAINLIHILS